MTKKFTVFNERFDIIGEADSIHECKEMHKKHYQDTNQDDLLTRYAGLDCTDGQLKAGAAYPVFYDDGLFNN